MPGTQPIFSTGTGSNPCPLGDRISIRDFPPGLRRQVLGSRMKMDQDCSLALRGLLSEGSHAFGQ